MTTTLLERSTASRSAVAATGDAPHRAGPADAPVPLRVDVYVGIHKAMRLWAQDVSARLGRIDVEDDADVAATLSAVDELLDALASHLRHENDFIHPFIEARRPGVASAIAGEHREHVEAIGELRAAVAGLRDAAPSGRAGRALSLYRTLQLFIAENLVHMHDEETRHNAAMWAAYSDAEIVAMHGRLVASLTPKELMSVARWMLAAGTPQEVLALLREMRTGMPAPAFEALLDLAREQVPAARWSRIAAALGVPEVPGLVAMR